MSNHSVIGQTVKVMETKDKSSPRLNISVWSSIAGFIMLGGAINSFQYMIARSANDIYTAVFIENWMPWLMVLCFALGWFVTHWIEVALSKNQSGFAKLLWVVLFGGAVSISSYFQFFSNHGPLHGFNAIALTLVMSGYFLRSSVFQQASALQLQKGIFGRWTD